jgi:hypothetical protein
MLKKEIDELCEHIKISVTKSSGKNSMWKIFGLSTRAELVEPKDAVEARLALISSQVAALSSQLGQLNQDTFSGWSKTQFPDPDAADPTFLRLNRELLHIATQDGVGFIGMHSAGGHASLTVRSGTLNPRTASLLKDVAIRLGFKLTIFEKPDDKAQALTASEPGA